MTRNEFIATTAARMWASEEISSPDGAVRSAKQLVAALESANVAPWRDEPPALSSAAILAALADEAKVIIEDLLLELSDGSCRNFEALSDWLRRYRAAKESVQ